MGNYLISFFAITSSIQILNFLPGMKTLLLSLAITFPFFFSTPVLSQSIRGQVQDPDGNPLSHVSVLLLNSRDSSLVKGALSDESGAYVIDHAHSGNYILSALIIGYKLAYGQPITLTGGQTEVKAAVMRLSPDTRHLKEITVSAKRPFVEQKMDRMVVNVANSIIASGSTALDVLEKAPGVAVDHQNSQLQLRGRAGVIVQIEGRQTYLDMTDVMALLRSMSSDNIDRIELITNPSAKYDAAGNSGIIDIRLKKNNDVGTNGSLSLGAGTGRYGRQQGSLQLNHRTPKVNLFGNYSASRIGNYWDYDYGGEQTVGLESNFLKQYAYFRFKTRGQNVKAGLDYFISKNTTIGLMWTGFWSNHLEEGPAGMSFRHQESEPIYLQTLTDKTQSNVSSNQAANLNFQHSFGKAGGQLTADVDLGRFSRDFTNTLLTETLLSLDSTPPANGLFIQMPTVIDIQAFKIDYNHSLADNWKLELGLKSSWVQSDNDLTFLSGVAGNLLLDPTLSNHFRYTERVKAAYASFSGKLAAKADVKIGLRTEHTHSEGDFITLNNNIKRNYLDFFPHLSFSQTLSAKHTLDLSYSYRIDRPNYQNLNPGRALIDPYTYSQGNPYLQPQYTHSLELKHGFDNKVFTSFGANYIHDLVLFVVQPVDGKTTEVVPENIGKSQAYNLTISFPVTVRKGWTLQTTLMGLYSQFQYIYMDTPLQVRQMSGRLNGSNAFTLGKGWTAEVTGWLNTPTVGIMFHTPWLGTFDAGLQKSLSSRWKAKLSVQDILHTNQFKAKIRTTNYNTAVLQRMDTRVCMLNLSYAFGNQQLKGSRQRQIGSEEETQRAN
jgi:hypothetical protein